MAFTDPLENEGVWNWWIAPAKFCGMRGVHEGESVRDDVQGFLQDLFGSAHPGMQIGWDIVWLQLTASVIELRTRSISALP